MQTNVVKALSNIKENGSNELSDIYILKAGTSSENRINSVGEALEFFVKDAFCDTFGEKNIAKKQAEYNKFFSYIGNQNNPPDIILKKSDAIEVKKIDGVKAADLALNSSYPKSKLYSDSPMITTACKNCEQWKEKDMLYSVGFIEGTEVKLIIFIYGDCYAASREIYERVRGSVVDGLKKLNLELAETDELGRVNRVDPLGITNLRIRGMWTIQNPLKVFSGLLRYEYNHGFSAFAIMRKSKFESLDEEDKNIASSEFGKEIVKIRDPDNPAKILDAVLLKFISH